MKDTDDDFFDAVDFDDVEFAETEAPAETRCINWRRIERIRERQWLKEQTQDFQDWAD